MTELVPKEEAEALRLRNMAMKLIDMMDSCADRLGEVLTRIHDEKLYLIGGTKYKSFPDYIVGELGRGKRWGYYRIKIHRVFKELGLSEEQLNGVTWTKRRALLPVVGDKEFPKLLKYAQAARVQELADVVKTYQRKGLVDIENAPIDYMRIPIWNKDQREFINETLKLAEDVGGKTTVTGQIEIIFAEFWSTHGPDGSHSNERKEIEALT